MIGVLRSDDARIDRRDAFRSEHVVETVTRSVGRKARRLYERAQTQMVPKRPEIVRFRIAIEVGTEHDSIARTELARNLLALLPAEPRVERKGREVRHTDRDAAAVEIDVGRDHAALLERVDEHRRGYPVKR